MNNNNNMFGQTLNEDIYENQQRGYEGQPGMYSNQQMNYQGQMGMYPNDNTQIPRSSRSY